MAATERRNSASLKKRSNGLRYSVRRPCQSLWSIWRMHSRAAARALRGFVIPASAGGCVSGQAEACTTSEEAESADAWRCERNGLLSPTLSSKGGEGEWAL